jgi:transposase
VLCYVHFRYSLLPALALDGMIYAKVVEGSFTSLFCDFLDGILDHMQPFPAPKSVIIMDNAQIHKDPTITEMIKERYVSIHVGCIYVTKRIYCHRGMHVLFLPPYSPDYNPIELAFSVIKAFVQHDRTLGREDLDQKHDDTYVYIHLLEMAFSISVTDALGFFHHCSYI